MDVISYVCMCHSLWVVCDYQDVQIGTEFVLVDVIGDKDPEFVVLKCYHLISHIILRRLFLVFMATTVSSFSSSVKN